MINTSGKRDLRFDVIKGIAICFIIVGHVIQDSFLNSDDSLIMNIIWSVQIPLFMVVSGFFAVKGTENRSFKTNLLRKSITYLLPCVSYLLIVSYINGTNLISMMEKTVYQMETSLWYLFVLYILSVISDIRMMLAKHIVKGKSLVISEFIKVIIFYVLLLFWVFLYWIKGSAFLGSKFILYYSIFFIAGNLWNTIWDKGIINPKVLKLIFSASVVLYGIIIFKINLLNTNDTILGALPRIITGFTGVYIIVYCVFNCSKLDGKIGNIVAIMGRKTKELYYTTQIVRRIVTPVTFALYSVGGIITILIYAFVVTGASFVVINLLEKSSILSLIVFGNISTKN